MRSSQPTSEVLQQFERASALMLAQQSLETERRSLFAEARASDREHLEQLVYGETRKIAERVVTETNALHEFIKGTLELHGRTYAKLEELSEKLDRLYEIVGIPRDNTVPTLAEQLNAAQSDAAVRKEIQRLVAEAEFENTEIEYLQ